MGPGLVADAHNDGDHHGGHAGVGKESGEKRRDQTDGKNLFPLTFGESLGKCRNVMGQSCGENGLADHQKGADQDHI